MVKIHLNKHIVHLVINYYKQIANLNVFGGLIVDELYNNYVLVYIDKDNLFVTFPIDDVDKINNDKDKKEHRDYIFNVIKVDV